MNLVLNSLAVIVGVTSASATAWFAFLFVLRAINDACDPKSTRERAEKFGITVAQYVFHPLVFGTVTLSVSVVCLIILK